LGPKRVELRARHNVNGQLYGPGIVTVPHELAEALQEAERNARSYDQTWMQEKAKIIGGKDHRGEGSYKATSVNPSVFNEAMNSDRLNAGETTGQEASNLMPQRGPDGHTQGFKFSDER